MDDSNRPSSQQQQQQPQPQPQQQQQQSQPQQEPQPQQYHHQSDHQHDEPDHHSHHHQHQQQQPQPGAEVIEATISSLLSTHAARPSDYRDILPKFSSQLKTDFENRNLWLRYGLTIALSKDSPQSALQAFNECLRIDQDDPVPAMLAARILLEQLDDPEQALKVADEAISRCKKQVIRNPVNISNGIDALDNSSIEMMCSSDSSTSTSTSTSTSNHSSSQSTIIQVSNSTSNNNNNNSMDVHLQVEQMDNHIAHQPSKEMKTSCCKNVAPILSRCYILASVTHAYLYEREPESIRQLYKKDDLRASLELLDLAYETNPNDHLVYFHKALHEANQRTYPKAIDNLRRAIQINPHHIPSIQLLILSLSALKLYDEALKLCEAILQEHENDLTLLFFKCNLEQCLVESKGYKVALGTAQHMLKCIRRSSSPSPSSSTNHVSGHKKNYSSTTTISAATQSMQHNLQLSSNNASTANTITANSSAATMTSAASNASAPPALVVNNPSVSVTNASNCNVNAPATVLNSAGDSKHVSNLFADDAVDSKRRDFLSGGELSIWILVAEIYVKIGSVEDAEMCVDEGSVHANGALSHQVMYVRGLIAKAKNHLLEAKTFFQSCLALCPRHAKALQQVAHVHYLLGNFPTAEKFLRDSLDLDGDCHKTWYYLSLVYIELNQHERANECVKKSTVLEEGSPSVPFSAISRLTLQ